MLDPIQKQCPVSGQLQHSGHGTPGAPPLQAEQPAWILLWFQLPETQGKKGSRRPMAAQMQGMGEQPLAGSGFPVQNQMPFKRSHSPQDHSGLANGGTIPQQPGQGAGMFCDDGGVNLYHTNDVSI